MTYKPRSIIPKLSVRARGIAGYLQRNISRVDWPDYTMYVVKNTGRSWCDYTRKVIIISGTVFDPKGSRVAPEHREELYAQYIIAHELAHSYAGFDVHHGPQFMEWLKKLCPPEVIHYELGYKPRNAYAAGIRHPDAGKITVNLTDAQKDLSNAWRLKA